MELTQEQKAAVAAWVEDGASLAEVQRRIRGEFGVPLTYMEVRLLVLDIGATPKEKPKPAEKPANQDGDGLEGRGRSPSAPQDEFPEDTESSSEGPASADLPPPDPADSLLGGKVSVELDKVVRAGAAMSGSVTFSDGVTGSWMLDAYGRLALTKVSKAGYQPKREDLEAFQIELQRKLGY